MVLRHLRPWDVVGIREIQDCPEARVVRRGLSVVVVIPVSWYSLPLPPTFIAAFPFHILYCLGPSTSWPPLYFYSRLTLFAAVLSKRSSSGSQSTFIAAFRFPSLLSSILSVCTFRQHCPSHCPSVLYICTQCSICIPGGLPTDTFFFSGSFLFRSMVSFVRIFPNL